MEKKNENNLCSSTVLCYRIYNMYIIIIVLLRYDVRRTASEFEIGEQYNNILSNPEQPSNSSERVERT